ncbi:CYTH domain-containing protein [Paraburkholderia hayleyella]|uniref:CYTH domain-containing protein n=1 Tax=Paraburkholderia hayleyella TaxID=2152889 RepID=UPI00129178D0|nr:CYTH domain-containing protein [Paraburkholderia hayleyella]
MSLEHEIKLALPTAQVSAAAREFVARSGEAGRDIALTNIYFDTPSLALARTKSALRLRHTPAGWLQTFKTLGVVQEGLHRRHEWELPVAGEALELPALLRACDDAQAAAALHETGPALVELFRTVFTRTLWLVRDKSALIEAVIDQGEVLVSVSGEVRRAPISEIELELKDGDEAALQKLAAELTAMLPGVVPDNISKAERGYLLLQRETH